MNSKILIIITINLISFCGLAQSQEIKKFDLIDLIELSYMNLDDATERLYKLGFGKKSNNKTLYYEFMLISTFETQIIIYSNGDIGIVTSEGKLNNAINQLNTKEKIIKLGSEQGNDGFLVFTYLSSNEQFLVGVNKKNVKMLISKNKGYDSYKD